VPRQLKEEHKHLCMDICSVTWNIIKVQGWGLPELLHHETRLSLLLQAREQITEHTVEVHTMSGFQESWITDISWKACADNVLGFQRPCL
jgi:hypothetical protein